ncbi:MAG TPA: type II toxin-antitoxin system death-on-curing family toxin [Candidatus Nitrosotalea sp.]|nr:type II toxin-antitoxin system death-on-curing family toxin [Candidatus Nitrosotalea sp.]
MKKPVWIEEEDVLVLHARLLALDGGPAGIRSAALLQSVLARPKQLRAYGGKRDIVSMAALYTAGIVRNHPFVDGNKRTGFLVSVLFLELNGYRLTATEEDATQAILELAAGTLGEDGFEEWLRANATRE